MGSFTDYTEDAVLDHIFVKAAFTQPAEVYMGLFSVMPDDAGAGGTEYTGYDGGLRLPLSAVMGTASGGIITNTGAVVFNNFDSNQAIVGGGVFDADTGGNLLLAAEFTLVQNVTLGNPCTVDAAAFVVSLT